MDRDEIHQRIEECIESIETSVILRDWNMVKAWEERLEYWRDQLFGLGDNNL